MRSCWIRAWLSLVLVVGSAGCSKSSATTPDAGTEVPSSDAGNVDDAGVPVGVTTRTWIDTTRPTPQNGSAPAQSSRTLVTNVWYPTSAQQGTAVPDAPLAPGGPYPLVLFVHGSSGSR